MNSSSPYDPELRRCLEEAGLYEENMDQEDMLHYYDAIKSSENSAKEEIEHRNLLRESEENVREIEALRATNKDLEVSLVMTDFDGITDEFVSVSEKSTRKPVSNEKPFTPKILSTKKTTELENVNSFFTDEISVQPVKEAEPYINLKQSKVDDSSEESVNLDDIDVYNCAPTKHKPLEVIMHDPKYKLPLYYEPKFLDMDLKARKNVLFDFHNVLLKNFYKVHCKSINPVQYGKPIPANGRSNGSLDRKISNFGEEGLAENPDDNAESSEDTQIYTSRSGRQTKRKVYSESFFSGDNESKKSKKAEDTPFKVATKSPAKRQCLSKLSNQDIMKRSKLFTDSSKGSRAERMFDSLVENDAKKKQADKEMDVFKETLKDVSDDEDFIETSQEWPNPEVEIKEIKPKEMTPIRRRIPPPLRGRRGINSRINSSRGKATKPLEIQMNRQQSQEISSTEDLTAAMPEPKQKSGKQMAKCPICSDSFVQEEIEEHASSCGLAMETESNFESVNTRNKKIKCNICDMEMLLNTDYEVHVKECLVNVKSTSSLE